jgi:hypothetical protein
MNKFDGSNIVGWLTQMGRYFSLHEITNDLMKLNVGVLYLDLEVGNCGNGIQNLMEVILLRASL